MCSALWTKCLLKSIFENCGVLCIRPQNVERRVRYLMKKWGVPFGRTLFSVFASGNHLMTVLMVATPQFWIFTCI